MDHDFWEEQKSVLLSAAAASTTHPHINDPNDVLCPNEMDNEEEFESSNNLLRQMLAEADEAGTSFYQQIAGLNGQGEAMQHMIIQNHQQHQLKFLKMSTKDRMPSSNPSASSSSSSSSGTPISYHIREKPVMHIVGSSVPSTTSPPISSPPSSEATCAVCGDGHAKLHYGVLACYGCKGFFRRTLTGKYRYVCRFGNNCIVDKYQRNSCRYCRFNRCLAVGMDPKAVRPDRDLTGKQKVPRARKRQMDEELINHMMRLQGDDWSRKIPVEAKVLLMQLLNIESKVAKGDSLNSLHPNSLTRHHSLPGSLPSEKMQKPSLSGRRTEMGYEPYRMARAEELSKLAHRTALHAVDWVESLAEIGEFMNTEDKIALVKSCYAPLTIFNFSARTAENTKNPDILCLCTYSYVPRKLPPEFDGSNHLSNNLIDRTLNELVAPLRKLNLREEEVVPLKAIIILNPNAKGLSPEGQQHVAELRDKVQEMLFQIVKELRPVYNASSRFGNLLLLLPTITTLSGVMSENVQFGQVFGTRTTTEPLLRELFDECKTASNTEEIISSSTAGLLTPPLLENPADINLTSMLPSHYNKGPQSSIWTEKTDSCTQTDSSYCSEDCCCSPLTSLSSNSLINGYSPCSHHQKQTEDSIRQVNLSPFPAGFESGLLDDCELADSTYSPGAEQLIFDSAECVDLFGLMQ
uniref:Uncharacterized protein n=1 Tax=Ditylenchus dipsaci TaxID=166011 RepID=A0A915CTV5_9BILA